MAKVSKQYGGSCYLGVVGAETEIGECRASIERINRRPGDEGPYFFSGTKGYEVRQLHINKWYNETQHPYIMLLDADMMFLPEALEQLRNHGLPFVSGYYMRRRYAPVAPVWFRPQKNPNQWPLEPWWQPPESGKLYELGASGWGFILLHRDVVTATKPLLKGEPEIIEDDMDMYPYNLGRIMDAIHGMNELAEGRKHVNVTALTPFLNMLQEEIKPLRCLKSVVGSDIRYPFFARLAGYKLMGDPDAIAGHMINYPVTGNDYRGAGEETWAQVRDNTRRDWREENAKIRGQRNAWGLK